MKFDNDNHELINAVLNAQLNIAITSAIEEYNKTWFSSFYATNALVVKRILGNDNMKFDIKLGNINAYLNDKKVFRLFHRGKKLKRYITKGLQAYELNKAAILPLLIPAGDRINEAQQKYQTTQDEKLALNRHEKNAEDRLQKSPVRAKNGNTKIAELEKKLDEKNAIISLLANLLLKIAAIFPESFRKSVMTLVTKITGAERENSSVKQLEVEADNIGQTVDTYQSQMGTTRAIVPDDVATATVSSYNTPPVSAPPPPPAHASSVANNIKFTETKKADIQSDGGKKSSSTTSTMFSQLKSFNTTTLRRASESKEQPIITPKASTNPKDTFDSNNTQALFGEDFQARLLSRSKYTRDEDDETNSGFSEDEEEYNRKIDAKKEAAAQAVAEKAMSNSEQANHEDDRDCDTGVATKDMISNASAAAQEILAKIPGMKNKVGLLDSSLMTMMEEARYSGLPVQAEAIKKLLIDQAGMKKVLLRPHAKTINEATEALNQVSHENQNMNRI